MASDRDRKHIPAEATAFAGSRVFDRLFTEGIALVEETANYLDGMGRKQSKALAREPSLTYAAWSMELTTRLMQAASWLVMHKAVRDGDMRREDAEADKYRLRHDGDRLDAAAQRGLGLPDQFLDLVERSEALYERICRLDEALYVEGARDLTSPIRKQLEQLEKAAATGIFDPLSVWSKVR